MGGQVYGMIPWGSGVTPELGAAWVEKWATAWLEKPDLVSPPTAESVLEAAKERVSGWDVNPEFQKLAPAKKTYAELWKDDVKKTMPYHNVKMPVMHPLGAMILANMNHQKQLIANQAWWQALDFKYKELECKLQGTVLDIQYTPKFPVNWIQGTFVVSANLGREIDPVSGQRGLDL